MRPNKNLFLSVTLTTTVSALFLILSAPTWSQKEFEQTDYPLQNPEMDNGKPTDFRNPIGDGPDSFHVTICKGHRFVCHPFPKGEYPNPAKGSGETHEMVTPSGTGPSATVGSSQAGTDGGVVLTGNSEGITLTGVQIEDRAGHVLKRAIRIHVIDCDHPPRVKGFTIGPGQIDTGSSSIGIPPAIGGSTDSRTPPPTRDTPHDNTTDDSSTPPATPGDTICDTTQATGGQPGVFGGSATVTAPPQQVPVTAK